MSSASAAKVAVKLPDLSGWEQATTQVKVFWNKEGFCMGKLLAGKRVSSQLGDSTLYSIALTQPCTCVDEDDKEAPAKVGEVIGVWGSSGLNALDDLSGCEVCIVPLPKQNLSGGRTFLPFDIKFKGQKKPLQLIRSSKSDGDDAAADGPSFP